MSTAAATLPRLGSSEKAQVVVRIVPRGGAKSATQILSQWMYLSREGDLPLQRSERHLAVPLIATEMKATAESWVREAGFCTPRSSTGCEPRSLTTHIVISFPIGIDQNAAFAVGRAWAEEMFGSGRHGGTFDYLTACHDDRPHPHVHLVVNRRALEGHWLKISRRHPDLSYDQLRTAMVAIAEQHGIALDASSRVARGLLEPPLTYAEYRRRARRTTAAHVPKPAKPGSLHDKRKAK